LTECARTVSKFNIKDLREEEKRVNLRTEGVKQVATRCVKKDLGESQVKREGYTTKRKVKIRPKYGKMRRRKRKSLSEARTGSSSSVSFVPGSAGKPGIPPFRFKGASEIGQGSNPNLNNPPPGPENKSTPTGNCRWRHGKTNDFLRKAPGSRRGL